MKKIIICYLIILTFLIFAQNKPDQKEQSIIDRYNDILMYGIESEVVNVLSNLGTTPRKEFYPLLLDRFNTSTMDDVRIQLANFFSNCTNLPENIIDEVYNQVKAEPTNIKLHITLLNLISKKGNSEQQKLLIDRLDFFNDAVKNACADYLSQMTNKELAIPILNRLELSDKDNEKFLSNDIKSKLILALGKMESKESLDYLRNAAKDESNDKFIIMYSMVSLANMQDAESIPLIKKNLSSTEKSVQEYAAYSISLFKTKDVLPILKEMLRNNDDKIRAFACQGMVLNNDPESIKILLYKTKNDPSPGIRNEALSSLIYMGNTGINALKDSMKDKEFSDNELYVMSLAVSKKPDPANVDFIMSLYDKLDNKKKEIIYKNTLNGNSNLLDKITVLLLKSNDPLVRISALKTIYQTKDSTLWPLVKEISEKDENENVKKIAKSYLDLRSK